MLKTESFVKDKKLKQLLKFCLQENLSSCNEKIFEEVQKCRVDEIGSEVYLRLCFLVREEISIFIVNFFIEEELYEKTKLFTKEYFKFVHYDEQNIFILKKDGSDLLERF